MKERLKTKIVQAEGPWTSKVCFIGEAPGEEEDHVGRPFIGSAGQLLMRCFKQKGFVRDEVILGNLFLQRPPHNDVKYFFHDTKFRKPTWEGEEHLENLRKFLRRIRDFGHTNLLVALGAAPLKILTGKEGITKWRGSVLPCTFVEGFKVYPTYHPSFVNRLINEEGDIKQFGEKKKRQQNVLPVFLRDLERIQFQMQTPDFSAPEREIYIDWSVSRYVEYLDSLKDGIVAVDIETLPSDYGPIVWCIGFSHRSDYAVVIPFIRNKCFAWSESEQADLLRAISRLFLRESIKKVFHNGTYDTSVLGRFYGLRVANGSYEDTMWGHHASFPYIRKGLATLTSIHTWEPYYKDDGKFHFSSRTTDNAEFTYNGKDCCVTIEIFPTIKRDAKELSTYQGYRRTMSVVPHILGMMLRGVKINLEAKEELTHDFRTKANFHHAEVNRITGGNYNLNSTADLRKLLYGFLGLEIQYHSKTRKPTTDKGALHKLRKKYPREEVLSNILEYKKFEKLAGSYGELKLDPIDHRARTDYQWVSTWRTNSSGSPFIFDLERKKQAGGNLQQIPKRTEEGRLVRRLFIPDEGMILLCRDLSQAEARFVAWDSEDLEDIELFLKGEKNVHWERAKAIFNFDASIPLNKKAEIKDNITKESHKIGFYYDLGKRTVHAKNYEMGPFEFRDQLAKEDIHIEFSVCKNLLASYENKKPMLKEWKRKIREQIKLNRTLITPLGRKREFVGRINETLFKAAYAFRPQSTVGEILQIGMQEVHERIPTKYNLLMNVHDEVVGQCYPKDIPEVCKVLDEAFHIPLSIQGRELIIPGEYTIGLNWGQQIEINDPKEAMEKALEMVKK